MDYRDLGESGYFDFIETFLKEFEGYGGGTPYRDATGDHIPTIGYGIRIDVQEEDNNYGHSASYSGVKTVFLESVLKAMDVDTSHADYPAFLDALRVTINQSAPSNSTLQTNIDFVWDNYSQLHTGRADFQFETQQEAVQAMMNLIADHFESRIEAKLADGITVSAHSFERAIMISMAYHGSWNESYSFRNSGLGNDDSDLGRAIAWFELEFRSNGDSDASTATRRFAEAEAFRLYKENDGAQSLDEAATIARFVYGKSGYTIDGGATDIFQRMVDYFGTTDTLDSGTAVTLQSRVHEAQLHIDNINTALGDSGPRPIDKPIVALWDLAEWVNDEYNLGWSASSFTTGWSADQLVALINWQVAIQSDKHFVQLAANSDITLDGKIIDMFKADAAIQTDVVVSENADDVDTDGYTIAPTDLSHNTILLGSDDNDTITTGNAGTKSVVLGLGGNDTVNGGDADDLIDGGAGNDSITGGGGVDTMFGGLGNDTIDGATDNDTIIASIGHDSVIGGAGSDTINGYTGADVLDGGQGADADLIIGDAGADKLVYWGGQDTFNGGSGNDYIDTTGAATDNLTLQLDKGFGHDVLSTNTNRVKDVLLSTIDKADVELIWNYTSTETQTTGTKFLVQMVGEAVIKIKSTGDTIYIPELRGYYDKNVNTQYIPFVGSVQVISYANDSMLNPFNIICQDGMIDWVYHLTDELNTFTSGTVSDEWKSALTDFQTERETEDDGQGADSDDLISGNDDNNNLNGGNGNDTVSGGGGNDLVNASGRGTDIYTGGSGSDALTFVSTTMGVTANLSLGTTSGAETENDTFSGFENLIGGRGNDSLTGDDNANEITGGAGNDTLDGGSGVDTLTGGLGNDVYLITSLADTLVEQAAEGTDRIETDISYTLTNEFENLTLTGTSALNGTGNAAANVLTGNSAANYLFGLDGDDTLSSGGGSDTLAGGMGDDVYVISDLASTLVEEANEGTDLIVTDLTFILADTFENLTLTGAGNVAGTGNIAANTLTGNSGANSLSGLTGNDTLYGNSGNDTLTGGAGADNMVGGAGNDTFDVDNLADTVVEITGQGTDLVQSSVNWTLSTYLENLTLTGSAAISGTGNIVANSLTGNAAANLISGLEGNDTIVAGDGNDTLDGGLGNDSMTGGAGIDTAYFTGTTAAMVNLSTLTVQNTGYGLDTLLGIENVTSGEGNDSLTGDALANALSSGAGNDTLFGGAGNDTLNGGAGVDQMTGGADNDSYVVDAAGDTTIEIAGGGTADAVTSSVTFTLAVEVENLTLSGTAAINGTGNAVANILTGNTGANVLTGLAGNDNLVGGAGNDTLDGGADNDTLNGGTGADSMTGGAGNDIYVVGEAADKIIEVAAGGTDTVQSAISFTLGVDVENLTLLGTAAINGVGNASANTIVGNTAANTLLGGAGNDILNGGTGTDSLSGGVGNDTYIVDVATDIVVELANEGTDLVKAAVTHTLLANFENLTLLATTAINGTGNAVANILTGGTGANILSGLGGNDALAGGTGNDTMVGGTGADAFVFVGTGNGTDTISDFNELNGGAEEGDVLQINGALVGTFVYRGASAFTGGSNNSEARIAGNQVLVDANGDGVTDITITLTGLTAATQLAATDFMFA